MRIEQIRIGGVLRFTDPVTVDLSGLPPGLIAVVGENGSGKTTLLESPIAALYRKFPTRDGPGRSLVDFALGADSFLESVFTVEDGTRYRARVALDGVHRKSEAVLTREVDGVPEILTDGKVSTYDSYIKQHFPPFEVLLASAFAAQNRRGSFAILNRADRKTLFAALLGLERYDQWAQTARTAISLVDRAIERVRTERDVLARETSPEARAALLEEADRLQVDGGTAEARRVELRGQLDVFERDVAQLQEAVTAHEAAKATLTTVREQERTRDRELDQITAAQRACDGAHEDTLQRILADEGRKLAEIERKLTNNRAVLTDADAIRTAAREAERLDHRIEDLHGKHQALLTGVTAAREAEGRAMQADHDREQIQWARDHAVEGADVLRQVPCEGAGIYAECRFLTNARLEEATITDLDARLEKLGDTASALVAAQTTVV